tara:strand:+ start:1869 stop:2105 length:237 start_codon:yes stop_codon:yes gene_type:complete
MKATKQDIKAVIFAGCSLELNGVSICNLDHYMKNAMIKRKGKYQVWSDKHHCYELYHNIDEAVDKFFKLTEEKSHGKL